jgi:hypothetical protein
MYSLFLALHNIVRWVVLILLIIAVVRAFIGWFGKREWSQTDRKLGLFTTIGIDIQLLLGLLLYFFLSPITRSAFQDFGAAMGVGDLRFYALEHALYMVLAVVFAHLGSVLPKKASASDSKFKRAALCFSLALVLILIGIPWGRPLLPGLG